MQDKRMLGERLDRGEKLHVLFLNDVGFQYGAGMAHLRQVQSFLLLGHEVSVLCHEPGETESRIPPTPIGAEGTLKCIRQLPHIHVDKGYTDNEITRAVVAEVESLHPDIVIVGNLHAAKWPLEILAAIRGLGVLVIAFMHDCYLFTGRCAYPGTCALHETGCDESCPTAEEYPALAPSKIPAAWRLRRDLFCGAGGIPLAANSKWTLSLAQRSLQDLHFAAVVYYGLDEQLFRPIDRALARRLLGIPPDEFVILGGAINVNERRKGGHILREVVRALGREAHCLVFGFDPVGMDAVHPMGFQRDYRRMPLIYSAADLFVGTSLEEAFGQTLCEAAACGLPTVAFEVGGVPEVARHDRNARLVTPDDVSVLIDEIRSFMRDRDKRERFGRAGRALVVEEFTLQKQGERWMDYLRSASSHSRD